MVRVKMDGVTWADTDGTVCMWEEFFKKMI